MRVAKYVEDGRLTVHLTHNEGEGEVVVCPTSYGWFAGYAISITGQEPVMDEASFSSEERWMLEEWLERVLNSIKTTLEEWA